MKNVAIALALILVVAVAGCQKQSATDELKSDVNKASKDMQKALN